MPKFNPANPPEVSIYDAASIQPTGKPVKIRARVTDLAPDNGPGIVGSVELHYRVNNGSFQQIAMSTAGTNDSKVYAATIPGQTASKIVQFHILALDAPTLYQTWAPPLEQYKQYTIVDDITPPGIISVSPENGTAGVGVDTVTVVRFSEGMKPSSLTAEKVEVLFASGTLAGCRGLSMMTILIS